MRDLPVVSVGYRAAVDDLRGVVAAVFEHAVYVARPDDSFVVLHAAAHGHTPTSILVDDARPLAWGIRVGHRAAGRVGRVRIGPATFDARQAARWCPPAPPRGAVPGGGQARLAGPTLLAGPTRLAGLSASTQGFEAVARLRVPVRALVRALDTARPRDLVAALHALVGAGPGLTPSGDDAIVGFLAVLARGGATRQLSMVQSALPPLLARTSPISAHYLRLALAGHVGEHLLTLVDACLGGSAPPELVARVRATGATSGADALVGVDAALGLLARDPHEAVA